LLSVLCARRLARCAPVEFWPGEPGASGVEQQRTLSVMDLNVWSQLLTRDVVAD
jgi:hypothetical protein